MARMPVLAGGGLMMWAVLMTGGCQSTPAAKKPPSVPTTWNNTPKNNQVAGGNSGQLSPNDGKYPRVPDPAPPPPIQPVGGGGLGFSNPPSGPALNPRGPADGVTPVILPANRNTTITTPSVNQFDLVTPPFPQPPPSTNMPTLPTIK